MERVAIVGIGQTKHVASREELNYPELVYEAVSLALEDAAIGGSATALAIASSRHETQYTRIFRS